MGYNQATHGPRKDNRKFSLGPDRGSSGKPAQKRVPDVSSARVPPPQSNLSQPSRDQSDSGTRAAPDEASNAGESPTEKPAPRSASANARGAGIGKPRMRIFAAGTSSRPPKKFTLGAEQAARPDPASDSFPSQSEPSRQPKTGNSGLGRGGGAASKPGKMASDPSHVMALPPGLEWPKDPKARRVVEVLFKDMSSSRKAPQDDRQKAYRAACLSWHPDKNPKHEKMATEVFQFLQSLKKWYFDDT